MEVLLKMEMEFFSDDDLAGLFAELDACGANQEVQGDEMDASQRRYAEIIKKHYDNVNE